jgi:hypothetical protein
MSSVETDHSTHAKTRNLKNLRPGILGLLTNELRRSGFTLKSDAGPAVFINYRRSDAAGEAGKQRLAIPGNKGYRR